MHGGRSFMMEYDVHTLLDGLTLVATAWVIYMLRFKLKDTYQAAQDTVHLYYVVPPHSPPCICAPQTHMEIICIPYISRAVIEMQR